MLSIIDGLLYKLFRSKMLYVLLIIACLLPILSGLMLRLGFDFLLTANGYGETHINSQWSPLILISGRVTCSGDYNFLIIIGVALLIGKEFTEGTIRNTIVAGKSRTQIYFAYVVASIVLVLTITTPSYLIDVATNAVVFDFKQHPGLPQGFLITFGLTILVNIMVAIVTLLFAMLFKKTSSSIIFSILLFVFVGGIMSFLTVLLTMQNSSYTHIISWIPLVQYLTYTALQLDAEIIGRIVLITSGLIVVSGGLGLWRLNKTDIK